MGRKYKGNKKWSRKRKIDEKSAKAGRERKQGGGGGSWNAAPSSNAKFEAYYSLVGLHDTRYDKDKGEFVPCQNDEVKTAEREWYMSTLRSILPASFRIDRSLDPTIRRGLLAEVREFTGREMELEVELPRRSAAVGGTKDILERGAGENKDGAAKGDEEANGDDGEGEPEDEAAGTEANGDAKPAEVDGDGTKEDEGPLLVQRTIAPAKPIPFVSDGATPLGYQLSVDRSTLRRNASLAPLHAWLKVHTDCGHITRQETVSMIPPVVLDVKEGMRVLDMCAAPGSKTCQLLEVVGGLAHASENNGDGDEEREGEPKGYVVANDADPKRAYMLVNQLRRMNSPSAFVTSCDGQYFPILDDRSVRGTDKEGTFDRVLCDVPCSGDGTVRKNPGIWKHWNQSGSLSLHPLQLSIALRGARLTRVGGRLVYSTCSMNPVENESVVAELLRIADGALVLEDPRDRMEGLIARPGWSTWRVLREHSRHGTRKKARDWRKKHNAKMAARRREWDAKRSRGECPPPKERETEKTEEEDAEDAPSPYDTVPYVPPATWDEAALRERTTSLGFVEYASYDDVEPEWRRRVRASCFPPGKEEAARLQLHKCLRCLPQDMDTGGFFVALLKKVRPLGRDANERMDALARESRGGVDVEAHLGKGGEGGGETKGADGDAADDVVMTESSAAEETSAAEDKTDAEPGDAATPTTSEGGKEEEEEAVQKAPVGKIGMRHKHNKKEDVGKEDFMPCDPSLLPALIDEYGLAPTFPKEQIFVRASGEAKVLYFLTKSVKRELIDRGIQERVTAINSGLKCFERCSLQDKRVGYRLAQEGIQYVVPHMTKRVLRASMDDFAACVKTGFIPFDSFSEAFRKELEELATGSFIVALEGYEKDVSKKMYLAMWRRPNQALNCFVTKIEMDAIKSKMKALGHVAKEEDATNKGEEEGAGKTADEPAAASKDEMETN